VNAFDHGDLLNLRFTLTFYKFIMPQKIYRVFRVFSGLTPPSRQKKMRWNRRKTERVGERRERTEPKHCSVGKIFLAFIAQSEPAQPQRAQPNKG
jgi:hypothetical protein